MDFSQIQALYGLKWNPFLPEVPVEALARTPKIDSFCFRMESLVLDGGFAMITGEPGTGKSIVLRILADRLSQLMDLQIGIINRPQSGMSDFYREIGHIFGQSWGVSNRWGNFRTLSERWQSHIESTLLRPILLVDEAQEIPVSVLNELRLLSSISFDSRSIITVVLAGDLRLPERFLSAELAPLGSRIKTKYRAENASREELAQAISLRLSEGGNPALTTDGLIHTVIEHGLGNHRTVMQTCEELLIAGASQHVKQLDEKLFLRLYQPQPRQRKLPVSDQLRPTVFCDRSTLGKILGQTQFREDLQANSPQLNRYLFLAT
jgi:general secretion pathway protein A